MTAFKSGCGAHGAKSDIKRPSPTLSSDEKSAIHQRKRFLSARQKCRPPFRAIQPLSFYTKAPENAGIERAQLYKNLPEGFVMFHKIPAGVFYVFYNNKKYV